MTKRKLKTSGYYGKKTDVPFNFIPDGIREEGFNIEHDINVDNEKVTQFIHYNKPQHGCGSFAGIRGFID